MSPFGAAWKSRSKPWQSYTYLALHIYNSYMHSFKPRIEMIGVNPFVFVPSDIQGAIFAKAGKSKGPVPIHGTVNGKPFTQTLVRYAGEWRLYINTTMLKDSPKHVGEIIDISVDFDERDRSLPLHPVLEAALEKDAHARQVFDSLRPSHRHEINRYINHLKSEAKIQENVQRAVDFLNGKGTFVGRDKV